MSRPEKKIVFIYPNRSTFISTDSKILRQNFSKVWEIQAFFTNNNLIRNVKLFFQIAFGVIWADIVFCWFADFHSFIAVILSKVFHKKSIVIVGGYEIGMIAEISYGAQMDPKRSKRIRKTLMRADKVITVSKFLKNEMIKIYPILTDIEVIYNSVDLERFVPKGKKSPIILTVCLLKKENIKLKGLDIFIECAKYFPEYMFYIIGDDLDGSMGYLKSISPKNVKFHEYGSEEKAIPWFQKAKIYCQLSMIESFGVALVEAMSCDCIPIVTDRGALPEVVGDIGYIVPYGNVEATVKAISDAITSDLRNRPRQRAQMLFGCDSREKGLISLI